MANLETLRSISDDEMIEIVRDAATAILCQPEIINGGHFVIKGIVCRFVNRSKEEYGECIFALDAEDGTRVASLWDFSKADPLEFREEISSGNDYCIGEVSNDLDDGNTAGWIDNRTARELQAVLGL